MLKPFINKGQEKTYVIFSPMKGVLTDNGAPLANIKITRELTWNANQEGLVEYFYTDEQGRFSLPLHEDTFSMSSLTEFVANQYLSVERNGETDDFWSCGKMSEGLYSEMGYELKSLVCDLSSDFARVAGDDIASIATKCRWENIALETYDE